MKGGAIVGAVLLMLVLTSAWSSENVVIEPDDKSMGQRLDDFQHAVSRKVLLFSSNLDHMFSTLYSDENTSLEEPVSPSSKGEEAVATSSWLDNFFKDETYLNTKNQSYARLRVGYEFNHQGADETFYNLTARVRLPKTAGKIQLYFGEEIPEQTNLSYLQTRTSNEGVGIRYFLPRWFDALTSSASVGFSRLDNPYAKWRLDYPVPRGKWLVKPVQTFKYSRNKEFEEWTSLYIDRKLSDDELLRLLLQRSTQSAMPGMSYLLQLSYMNTFGYRIGFNSYLSASGRTESLWSMPYDNGTTPQAGIYEYAAGIVWRQKLFKDYLFYQVQPILSFHEQYDYSANPILRVSLELYFGNHQ